MKNELFTSDATFCVEPPVIRHGDKCGCGGTYLFNSCMSCGRHGFYCDKCGDKGRTK
jgi:hypothetical protein